MISNWTCRERESRRILWCIVKQMSVCVCLRGDTMREEGRITGVKWDKRVCRGLCVCVCVLCSSLCVAILPCMWVYSHWSVCVICACDVPAASQHQRVSATFCLSAPASSRRSAVAGPYAWGRPSPVQTQSACRISEREPPDWLFEHQLLTKQRRTSHLRQFNRVFNQFNQIQWWKNGWLVCFASFWEVLFFLIGN